jgi:hypothetical protein
MYAAKDISTDDRCLKATIPTAREVMLRITSTTDSIIKLIFNEIKPQQTPLASGKQNRNFGSLS